MSGRAGGERASRKRVSRENAARGPSSVIDYGKRPSLIGSILGFLFFSIVAGAVIASLAIPPILVASRTTNASIGFFEGLPNYITLDTQTQRNLIYANRDGQPVPIATVYDQDRQEVGWDEVSQFVKDATVAGEDRRFYDHGGIDVRSIVRAAAGNVVHRGITSGSSTIAMQLVKNLLVQRALRITDPVKEKAAYAAAIDDTLNRKIREMKYAIALEKRYSKKTVLLGYLNIAGFGGNSYGVEAAAQKYFSVSAKDVTLTQAASLVAMLQQPNALNLSDPGRYPANKVRRDFILGDMRDLGSITPEQYQEAVAAPITPKLQAPNNGCLYASDAKFACDLALHLVPTLAALGPTAAAREKAWAQGNNKIYLSIDLNQQDVAQANLSADAPAEETRFALGASAVSVQPGTGRILVMAQNKLFDNSEAGGGPTTTAVDYSTDRKYGGSMGFATGSTYKIFTLAQWLKTGHTLSDTVDGTPRTFLQSSFNSSCASFVGSYAAFNDTPNEGGVMTVAAATTNSINVAYLSMAEQLDLCDINAMAKGMGVHRADGAPLETLPTTVIGVNEIAPLTMAAAIATIGANGVYCAPTIIDRVITAAGTEVPGQLAQCSQALAPNISSTVAYALSSVMEVGTGKAGNPQDGVPIVGKTGTTNYVDQNWLVGTSTKVALAVWVGNTDGGRRNFRKTTIAGTLGYNTKFNIFRATMASLDSNPEYRGGAFPDPDPALVSGPGHPTTR